MTGAVTENEADKWVLGLSCVAYVSAAVFGAGSLAVLGAMLTIGLGSLLLRRVVGLGQISISLLFTVPVLYGGLVAGGLRIGHWLAAALVTVFVFARETIKGSSDEEGDLAAGYGTLATRYGKAGVLTDFRITVALLILVAFATAWLVERSHISWRSCSASSSRPWSWLGTCKAIQMYKSSETPPLIRLRVRTRSHPAVPDVMSDMTAQQVELVSTDGETTGTCPKLEAHRRQGYCTGRCRW